MSGVGRVDLARGYLLHRRDFRDTSLILELFTREHGRLTAFARGARGPRGRFGALQPFQPLLLSWSGRGEAGQLRGAEAERVELALPPPALMSAFYVNELLMKLTARHDAHPEIYDAYEQVLAGLRAQGALEYLLRSFELQLLAWLGYGLHLEAEADSGQPVRADAYYHFELQSGVRACAADAEQAVRGQVLLALAGHEPLSAAADQRQARQLMRRALDRCLEGRELATRKVARAIHRTENRD
ncbi:MAG: DNA repair protein RecO [Steroidobacteraceae bacterium]